MLRQVTMSISRTIVFEGKTKEQLKVTQGTWCSS